MQTSGVDVLTQRLRHKILHPGLVQETGGKDVLAHGVLKNVHRGRKILEH